MGEVSVGVGLPKVWAGVFVYSLDIKGASD
jgi:hypothetical protein